MPTKRDGITVTTLYLPSNLFRAFQIKVLTERGGRKVNDTMVELIRNYVGDNYKGEVEDGAVEIKFRARSMTIKEEIKQSMIEKEKQKQREKQSQTVAIDTGDINDYNDY